MSAAVMQRVEWPARQAAWTIALAMRVLPRPGLPRLSDPALVAQVDPSELSR
jgi:hypothetical protein